MTQLVHNQNHSIIQELGSNSHTMQEENKVANGSSLELQQQNSATIGNSFQLPHPEQLQSYEKMVAQIIRDSIEKENHVLKQ